MRVLFLSTGLFDKGGIARYGRYQLRAMRETFGGKSVCALSLLGRAEDDIEEPIDVSWAGTARPTVRSRARMVASALRAARSFRPDLVLAGHVNLGPLARVASRVSRAPYVVAVYGREVWSPLSRRRRRSLRGAHRVISDCHNTAAVAVRLGLLRETPDVVWDCVDLGRYRPGEPSPVVLREYGIERSRRFRVLFLGRISAVARYKGTDRLLHLISRLPVDRFEVVLAGKGDDIPHLKAEAERLGVGDRVIFTGAIHEDHLVDTYRSADAFYLVSEAGPGRGEGLPLTPIEAMACGIPVLVGDQDGSREILDGDGGWKGSPGDLHGQAAYLLELASDGDLLARERRAARRRVEAVFAYEAFRDTTCRLLRETVRKG